MKRSIACTVALLLSAAVVSADEVTLGDVKSKTPATWKSSVPASKLRMFQCAVPKSKGDDADGELAIFFFGAGGGGGIDDNLKRWKGFFEAPEGKSIDDVAKVEKFKVGKAVVTYLDVAGTFLSKNPPFDPNAKTVRKMNYRRLGVIFETEGGPYFITLTGPAATIAASKADFDGWLKNFK